MKRIAMVSACVRFVPFVTSWLPRQIPIPMTIVDFKAAGGNLET
jgi:hypothetical protein